MSDGQPTEKSADQQSHHAYEAGQRARREGQPREVVPQSGEAAARDWLAGWDNADAEPPPSKQDKPK